MHSDDEVIKFNTRMHALALTVMKFDTGSYVCHRIIKPISVIHQLLIWHYHHVNSLVCPVPMVHN